MSDNLPEPLDRMDPAVIGMREIAKQLQWQRDEIAKDLEIALNICRQYQRILSMLNANDPNWVEVNRMLTRYRMAHETHSNAGKIFVDGVDITEHPDSLEGSATEVEELPESDEQRELLSATEDAGYGYDGEGDDGDPC